MTATLRRISSEETMNDMNFHLPASAFGFTEFPESMRDIWEKTELKAENGILHVRIPKHGCIFIAFN